MQLNFMDERNKFFLNYFTFHRQRYIFNLLFYFTVMRTLYIRRKIVEINLVFISPRYRPACIRITFYRVPGIVTGAQTTYRILFERVTYPLQVEFFSPTDRLSILFARRQNTIKEVEFTRSSTEVQQIGNFDRRQHEGICHSCVTV